MNWGVVRFFFCKNLVRVQSKNSRIMLHQRNRRIHSRARILRFLWCTLMQGIVAQSEILPKESILKNTRVESVSCLICWFFVGVCFQATVFGQVSSEDELAEYLTEYDRDWYFGTETDHDWQVSIMNEKPFLFSLGRDKGKVGYYWSINSLLFLNDSGLFSFPIRAGMYRGSLKLQRERLKSSNNRFISNGNRTEWSAIGLLQQLVTWPIISKLLAAAKWISELQRACSK